MNITALLERVPANVATALQTLDDGTAQIRGVIDSYRAAVAEQSLAVSRDPSLSSEGRTARMQQIRQTEGDRAAAELQRVREALDAAHDTIGRNLTKRWPAPQQGVEALLSRQAAWARFRSLLEVGYSLEKLIGETTDMETMFALEEELPTWLRANSDRPNARPVQAMLVNKRIAELTGDFASAALEAAHEADVERTGLEPMLQHVAGEVRALIDRSGMLTAAIKANQARQQTRMGAEYIPDAS